MYSYFPSVHNYFYKKKVTIIPGRYQISKSKVEYFQQKIEVASSIQGTHNLTVVSDPKEIVVKRNYIISARAKIVPCEISSSAEIPCKSSPAE